jgi:hypothetical protein
MSRFRAATIHLAVSASLCLLLFAVVWWVWYPYPLLRALGGTQIFLILLGVDATLGPLLTAAVFNPKKASLRFDLSVIVIVQLAALLYGAYTLFLGRPVYIAAVGSQFDVVVAHEVDADELATTQQSLPLFGPQWVGTLVAANEKENERVAFKSFGWAGYGHFPQHHIPLGNMRDVLLANAKPIANLANFNPGEGEAIRAWLAMRGYNELNAVFQGLNARNEEMAVVLDKKTAEVIGIAPFRPSQHK